MVSNAVVSNLIVIPARYFSKRFPGKPLADLNGKSMLQHVWERAMSAKMGCRVVVATDDDRIADCVRRFGGEVRMTSPSHRTGTERVAEIAAQFKSEIVVNLQGDLPLFSPDVLDSLLEISADLIQHGSANLVTAKSKIIAEEEIFSPNTIKVVTDCKDQALYFSRSPIPYIEKGSIGKSGLPFNYYKHYGIYIYKRDFLLHIARSPEGPLEKAERLEQLRVLEQGDCVRVVEIDPEAARSFCEVNTPEDLIRAKALLSSKHIVG